MTENNKLNVFTNTEFGNLRTIMLDDEIWFVGNDVATALGYSNIHKAIQVHVDKSDKKILDFKGFSHFGSNLWGENDFANKTVVNESGLYSLIMSSKLPDAKKFRHWITSEVIPSIMRTGGYVQQGRENEFLETMFKNMQEQLIDNKTAILALQKQVIAQKELLNVKPDMYKINTWKKHTGTPAVERLASALGMNKVEKSLYGDIYEEMNATCGFNKVTAVMDYRAKYHLDEDIEVPPINAIADDSVYQRDFVITVNRMITKIKSVHTDVAPTPTPLDKFDAAIHSLIELRNDKSAHGAKTLALVYDRMHSKQSWAVMKGKNKCNIKKELIMKKDGEYDLFCKTVDEIRKELSND